MKQVLMQHICTRSESTVHDCLASAGLPVSWTWPDNASRRIQPGRHVVNICILEVWGTSHSALVMPYQVSGHGLSVAEPTVVQGARHHAPGRPAGQEAGGKQLQQWNSAIRTILSTVSSSSTSQSEANPR